MTGVITGTTAIQKGNITSKRAHETVDQLRSSFMSRWEAQQVLAEDLPRVRERAEEPVDLVAAACAGGAPWESAQHATMTMPEATRVVQQVEKGS